MVRRTDVLTRWHDGWEECAVAGRAWLTVPLVFN
jgi:hypothetical protein